MKKWYEAVDHEENQHATGVCQKTHICCIQLNLNGAQVHVTSIDSWNKIDK